MKFVILADRSYNFKKPLADGLKKTLVENGHDCVVFYEALYWIYDLNLLRLFLTDIYHLFFNILNRKRDLFQYRFFEVLTFLSKKNRKIMQECDCMICVENCPSSFIKRPRLDFLRDTFKKPIVSYDFHFLPNQGWWKYMRNGNHVGLEQFDWYLPVGLITEFAIPSGMPQIYDCIGLDLRCQDLYPEQDEFIVLLDFPRQGHELSRAKEKDTLEKAGIKYIELHGRYTTTEIRAIYRKVSAYFVSTRESFGLPIIELQLCGAKIFIPHKEWAPAHYLDKSPFESGVGNLGQNFVVYNNPDDLVYKLIELRDSFNPQLNINAFMTEYPDYYRINTSNLQKFVERLSNNTINYLSHISYAGYDELISTLHAYQLSNMAD